MRNAEEKSARGAHGRTGWHTVCTACCRCECTILCRGGAAKSPARGGPLRVEKNFVENGHRICSIGSRRSSCECALLARAGAAYGGTTFRVVELNLCVPCLAWPRTGLAWSGGLCRLAIFTTRRVVPHSGKHTQGFASAADAAGVSPWGGLGSSLRDSSQPYGLG